VLHQGPPHRANVPAPRKPHVRADGERRLSVDVRGNAVV
jgi:hypothetical protein